MTTRILLPLCLLVPGLLLFGCPPGDDTADTGPEADTDADSDADSDADGDADTDADVDSPVWEGQLTYQTTVDGKAACDAVVDLLGSPYTGDCFDCDLAYNIDATLVQDDGTAACEILNPYYTYLEDQVAWFRSPVMLYWEEYTYYGYVLYTDLFITGFAVDYTSYGGGYYAGPYWQFLSYEGMGAGTVGEDYPALVWDLDVRTTYYDYYTYYYYTYCPGASSSKATENGGGKWIGTGQIDTTGFILEVWEFTVPPKSTDPVYVSIDTTDPKTSCDMRAFLNTPDGCSAVFADDSFDCTFKAPYPCPAFDVAKPEAGTYQVIIWYTGFGTNAEMADYQIRVDAPYDPDLEQIADDKPFYAIDSVLQTLVSGSGEPIED